MKRKIIAVCITLAIPAVGMGATEPSVLTSTATASEKIRELFPPALARRMVIGTGVAIAIAAPIDRSIRRHYFPHFQSHGAVNLRHFGDAGQLAGPVIGTGFLIEGLAAHDQKSKDTAVLSYESFLIAGAASGILKGVIGRRRPSKTEDPFTFHPAGHDSSFPSGHTTVAFAAATVFSEQYPHWYVIVPAYAAASTVGLSRLYANQHWLSDVVAGALLGTVTSHLLRNHLRHSRGKTAWHLEPDLSGIRLVRSFGGN